MSGFWPRYDTGPGGLRQNDLSVDWFPSLLFDDILYTPYNNAVPNDYKLRILISSLLIIIGIIFSYNTVTFFMWFGEFLVTIGIIYLAILALNYKS